MDLKNLIQKMDKIESTQDLNESVVNEIGYPENPGAPVSMNISLNASGKEHVADLIGMMKHAGLGDVEGDSEASGPMRNDMEKFRSMIDEPHDGKGHEHFGTDKDIDDPEEPGQDEVPGDDDSEEGFLGGVAGGIAGAALGGPLGALTGAAAGDSLTDDEATEEGWDNEPEEEYRDHNYMTKDLSGGINREKPKGAIRAKDPAVHQTVDEDIDRVFNAIIKKDPGDEGIGFVFDKVTSNMSDEDADELAKRLAEFYPEWYEQHYQNEEVETSIKESLWAALNEKMAAEGRGRGKKKVMASRGRGKTEDIKETDCPECGKPGKKKLMACASCGCK